MILSLVWLSDSFVSLGIGWGWSKTASLTWLAVGAGCWLEAHLGLSAKAHGSPPCVRICDQLAFFLAITQHQFYWSNQRASSDVNGMK